MELFDIVDARPTTARLQFQKAYDKLQQNIADNHHKNKKAYERFDRVKNNSMIGATDLQEVMRGVIRKVEFTVRFLINECLNESVGQLSVVCKEQGFILERVSEEIKRNVNDMFTLLKNIYPSVELIVQEKNNFAEKALSLAKALRSLHENTTPSQFRLMSLSIDVMNIVNNIALEHGFTGYEIYRKLLYYLQTDEPELIFYPGLDVETPAETDFWCTETVLSTLETCYTTKLANIIGQHVVQVITAIRNKQRIIEEKRREEEEKEKQRQAKAEEETKKIYDDWKRLQQMEIVRIMKAKNKVDINEAAERAVHMAEKLSDQEIAHRIYLRRTYSAGILQMAFRKHKLQKRVWFRVNMKMSLRITRLLRCIALHSILHRRIQRTRRVKRAISLVTRICFRFVLRLRQIRWAAKVLTKSLKRRFEMLKMRRARRAMIRASQYKIDFEYKYHINVLEKRLERLETIMSHISPFLISQASEQWLDKSAILRDTKRYNKMVLPYSESQKENLHAKAITDVVNMEDRVNMLNVAIQSANRLAQLQSTLLNAAPKYETHAEKAVQCDPPPEPEVIEPPKRRPTIRNMRKQSTKPMPPKSHRPTIAPRLRTISSEVELHSDEEIDEDVEFHRKKPERPFPRNAPAATLAEEVERIVQLYGADRQPPRPVIIPKSSPSEPLSLKPEAIKCTAPAGILKRIEDIKKRSSAMVIGINQKEVKNFDSVGI